MFCMLKKENAENTSCLCFKSNSNREKQFILLMILSKEKYRTKSKGWWHYLAVKKLLVLLRGIIF